MIYCFKNTELPTPFNLEKQLLANGFACSDSAEHADLSDCHLTLNEADANWLEYKHHLARLLNRHCPEVHPDTYVINAENYIDVLKTIQAEGKPLPSLWILKPALLNNGEGIRIFSDLRQVATYFLGSNRYDNEHVLQHYISPPHLLNGHKYTFRMFVVITNFAGAYLYRYGYFNVGRQPYDETCLQTLATHLTNEHLEEGQLNVWQIPTEKCPNFEVVYQQMQSIVTKTLRALHCEAPDFLTQPIPNKAFSLFGFDFILDADLRLWLLEINHGPCFPKEDKHPLQMHLYDAFWERLVNAFVLPMVNHREGDVGCDPAFDRRF